MNLKAVFGTVVFTLKKCSPEILLGVGIVGVVGSTVLACTATLRAEEILVEAEHKSERIDLCVEQREQSELDYPVSAERKDRAILVAATAGKFVKLYGPSATLMVLSIFCIVSSYGIMKKRNIALMAAYKLVEEAFGNYRKRVVAELGERADSHFLYGEVDDPNREPRTITNEDGSEEKLAPVRWHLSNFSRAFGPQKPDQFGSWEGSSQWYPRHEYNLNFLTAKEQHFNSKLIVQGSVSMNEVLTELGFPPTEAGMICGWKYNSKNGDSIISFRPKGIDGNWSFGNDGAEIVLDFNIDGVIFDQTAARKEMRT